MVQPLKAISIRQPWAWAAIHGGKDIENKSEAAVRVIANRVIGQTLYVHASKHFSAAEFEDIAARMAAIGVKCPLASRLDFGGFIGTVRVMDIVKRSKSPWFDGPFGLVLADPKPCKFVKATGQVGVFDARAACARAII